MHAAPDSVCLFGLGLTAMLALEAGQSQALSGLSLPAWLPILGLAAFAVASSVLGVTDPETLAAAFGAV